MVTEKVALLGTPPVFLKKNQRYPFHFPSMPGTEQLSLL